MVDVTTSWQKSSDAFRVIRVWVTRGRKIVGKSVSVTVKTKPVKLRVTRTSGSTYQLVHVSNLPRGKLHFKLRATKLHGATKVITQVSQSRKR